MCARRALPAPQPRSVEAKHDPEVLPAGGRAQVEGRRPSVSPAEPAEVIGPGAGPLSAGRGGFRRAAGPLGITGLPAGDLGLWLRCGSGSDVRLTLFSASGAPRLVLL